LQSPDGTTNTKLYQGVRWRDALNAEQRKSRHRFRQIQHKIIIQQNTDDWRYETKAT